MANGFWIASFPFPEGGNEVETTIIEIRDGWVHTTADVDGPTQIELCDYIPVRRIDLAA
jgi:hypothetical protein